MKNQNHGRYEQTTARTSPGSIFATRNFFPHTRFTPTQNIITDPTSERLSSACRFITSSSRFESAVIVMIIYLSMTLLASYLLRAWEKALDGPQNYDLNTTDTLAYTSGMYNAPDPNHESQNLDMKGEASHV